MSDELDGIKQDYRTLTFQQRKCLREEYIQAQHGKCAYCGELLCNPALKRIIDMKIDWSLFPKEFLRYSVHLQHNHDTGMTEGAVHAYCNAVMWQYERR